MSERLDAVLLLRHPGEPRHRQIGKIVTVSGVPVYVFNWKRSSGLCRKLDAIGIEPATLEAMRAHGAERIVYLDTEMAQTLETTRAEVLFYGVLVSLGHGRMYHLPLRYWHVTPGMARYPRTERYETLDWIEPEDAQRQPATGPRIVQGALL